MPFIELIVSPQGESKLQTKGFAGADCKRASEFLEQALGQVSHEQFTAEYHEAGENAEITASHSA